MSAAPLGREGADSTGRVCSTGGCAAARCACAGTETFTARWSAVEPGGATIVTLVTLLTTVVLRLLTIVVLLTLLVLRSMFVTFVATRMPGAMIGGAPVTTAGGVPTGAITIKPRREPGGGGTNTPSGPTGARPSAMPTPTAASAIVKVGAGGTKD